MSVSFYNSCNEHFIIAVVIAIVVSLFRWTMHKPAKKIDGDGIVLKFSPVIYGLIIVPMLMIVTVFSWALWTEGMSEEAILPFGLGISMLLGFLFLV
jgi:uncharacterized membrane protein